MSTPKAILSLAAQVVTASGDSTGLPGLDVNGLVLANGLAVAAQTELGIDLNVTVLAAGTIQFYYDRKGADGNWYQVWTSGALAATGVASASIGTGQGQAAHIGLTGRLRWVLAGGATTVTFNASITGK